jgi:hypothetical protein
MEEVEFFVNDHKFKPKSQNVKSGQYDNPPAISFYDNNVKGNTMNELFEINVDGKATYGFKLAMNSENKLVMEEKGTGKIIVVSVEDVKEVVPYTVTIVSFDGNNAYNYTVEPGKLQVNDVVIHSAKGQTNARIGYVRELDTKVKGASQFAGTRLVSEKIA